VEGGITAARAERDTILGARGRASGCSLTRGCGSVTPPTAGSPSRSRRCERRRRLPVLDSGRESEVRRNSTPLARLGRPQPDPSTTAGTARLPHDLRRYRQTTRPTALDFARMMARPKTLGHASRNARAAGLQLDRARRRERYGRRRSTRPSGTPRNGTASTLPGAFQRAGLSGADAGEALGRAGVKDAARAFWRQPQHAGRARRRTRDRKSGCVRARSRRHAPARRP